MKRDFVLGSFLNYGLRTDSRFRLREDKCLRAEINEMLVNKTSLEGRQMVLG